MKLIRIIVCVLFVLVTAVFVYFKLTVKNDVTIPVIKCDSNELSISVKTTEEELLKFVTASDEKEGDLTKRIFIENMSPYISDGRTDITYVVCDSDNNVGRLTVSAEYTDYYSPRYVIKKPLVVPYRATDFDLNDYLEVDDCIDGNKLSDSIITVSDFSLTAPGTYDITLKTTNSRFDSSTINITILVASEQFVDTVPLSDYIVYCDVGDKLDYSSYIASDEIAVTIDSSEANLSKAGVYEVVYNAQGLQPTRLVVVCEEAPEQ